jgi:two-component system, NarL family, sensor histidine kinase DevS
VSRSTTEEGVAASLLGNEKRASERMVALHRATLRLVADLSLEGVLNRIVEAALELADARYAALGIPDGQGGLELFITRGLSEEEIRRIEHHPVGEGLLGEMMRSGTSIRLREISEHPRAIGFPPGHPTMHTFLGVPISAYGRLLGQIYLTDKLDAEEFTIDDQRLIEMLAAHSAAAIENARLYRKVVRDERELSQRNQELELINSLTSAVSSAMEVDALLDVMLRQVASLFGAQAGEVFLLDPSDQAYHLVTHYGEASQAFWEQEVFKLGQGIIGSVAKAGCLSWFPNLASQTTLERRGLVEAGFQSLVCVPLSIRGNVLGVLSLAFRSPREIEPEEEGLLEAVGAGIGVAVDNARLNLQARRLAVLEERERIGMDLHDGIIQSIYAVGLTLEYTRLLIKESGESAADRLVQAIDGLNSIIRDIRAYILDLQPVRLLTDSLEQAFEGLLREFKANSLVEVEFLAEEGLLETIDRGRGSVLFHIAQEGLANVGKHARATRVWLSIRREEDQILMQIIDNGRGFNSQRSPDRLGHGLSNMLERARQVGGQFTADSSPGEGTTITVRLNQAPDAHHRQHPA